MNKWLAYFFSLFCAVLHQKHEPIRGVDMSKIAEISEKMANQQERDLLFCAATLVGEARSEGYDGMQAVMNVIQNRLASPVSWWHKEAGDNVQDDTLAAVCIDAWQFSCWNDGSKPKQKKDPNFERCAAMADPDNFAENLKDKYFARAVSVASLALHGELPDLTHGSTHYHTTGVSPAWSVGKKPAIVIGRHKFFNNVK